MDNDTSTARSVRYAALVRLLRRHRRRRGPLRLRTRRRPPPKCASAWVQTLCDQANSQPCSITDPEFERIVDHFGQSGNDFRELVVELYCSPLVTGAERAQTHDKIEFAVSITRRARLCQTLDTRLQMNGACSGANNTAHAIPEDGWSRGSATPFQPAASSLFDSASMDSLCHQLSRRVVHEEGAPLQSDDIDALVVFVVETLMDLSAEDSRHDLARAAIEQHIEDARDFTGNDRVILESAFTVACTSPFVSSVGDCPLPGDYEAPNDGYDATHHLKTARFGSATTRPPPASLWPPGSPGGSPRQSPSTKVPNNPIR